MHTPDGNFPRPDHILIIFPPFRQMFHTFRVYSTVLQGEMPMCGQLCKITTQAVQLPTIPHEHVHGELEFYAELISRPKPCLLWAKQLPLRSACLAQYFPYPVRG
jgi:hypothetical protein